MNRNELLKYYKYIGLNEADFWNECLKEFGPEETKKMREKSRKNIRTEYVTTNSQSKPFFRNAFNYLMEKQEDGLIGWTEEDEDEFYGEVWKKYRRFEKSHSSTLFDDAYDDEKIRGPKDDPMHGGIGLGYDGEEDNDDFW